MASKLTWLNSVKLDIGILFPLFCVIEGIIKAQHATLSCPPNSLPWFICSHWNKWLIGIFNSIRIIKTWFNIKAWKVAMALCYIGRYQGVTHWPAKCAFPFNKVWNRQQSALSVENVAVCCFIRCIADHTFTSVLFCGFLCSVLSLNQNEAEHTQTLTVAPYILECPVICVTQDHKGTQVTSLHTGCCKGWLIHLEYIHIYQRPRVHL